uniref:Uncharacterized protein n=1 Tax=Zea mays TaxID=4577 RepID=B6SHU2_MAIZE|nr:hypothetical protein [Zea mays]
MIYFTCRITIWDCPVLMKNCQEPDGESWPKISHVRWKSFLPISIWLP